MYATQLAIPLYSHDMRKNMKCYRYVECQGLGKDFSGIQENSRSETGTPNFRSLARVKYENLSFPT